MKTGIGLLLRAQLLQVAVEGLVKDIDNQQNIGMLASSVTYVESAMAALMSAYESEWREIKRHQV